jgi:hypothetical protein
VRPCRASAAWRCCSRTAAIIRTPPPPRYKYIVVVDGNTAPTSRIARLLYSGSAMLRQVRGSCCAAGCAAARARAPARQAAAAARAPARKAAAAVLECRGACRGAEPAAAALEPWLVAQATRICSRLPVLPFAHPPSPATHRSRHTPSSGTTCSSHMRTTSPCRLTVRA